MKKKIAWIVGIVVILVLIFAGLSGRGADPAGYVQANLDLVYQGDTSGAAGYLDASSKELEQMYDEGIQAFTDQYLMGEMETERNAATAYDYLVKEVFAIMRYQVGEAKKTGIGTYEVEVSYQPIDVFTKFVPQVQAESVKIQKALNSGGYSGTQEEALASALEDYLYFAYEALEMAYLEAGYGEKETFTFEVKAGMGGSYSIQENAMNTFMERILELDNL